MNTLDRLPRLAGSLALCAALVLSGCSTAPESKAGNPSAPATSRGTAKNPSQDPSSTGEASAEESSGEPQASADFAKVDLALVSGAKAITLSAKPEGVTAATLRFEQARNLSIATEVVRNRMLRGAYFSDAKQVDITSQVISASPDVVGVLVTARTTVGSDTYTIPSTIWYSTAKKQSYSSPALIKGTQWPSYTKAVQEAVTGAGGDASQLSVALKSPAAPYGNGPALGFNAAGDLVLHFRSGAVAKQPVQVAIPADTATALLSQFGAAAQKGATSPSTFTGKPAAAADPELGAKTKSLRASTAIGHDCAVVKCVAMTYDDGPSEMTPTLMASAKKAQAGITFFQLGNSVKAYPSIARKVAAYGFEVGNHSMTHPNLPSKSSDRQQREVESQSALLASINGAKPMVFRPPYGAHNDAIDVIVGAQGMSIMQWDVDTNDWSNRSSSATAANALAAVNYTAPIVLGHDIQQASIDAAPTIYAGLQKQGRVLVTVSELSVNSGGYKAGHAYCRGTVLNQEGFNCKG